MYKWEPHCDDVKCPIRDKCYHFADVRITEFPFEIFKSTGKNGKHPCRVGDKCNCFMEKPEDVMNKPIQEQPEVMQAIKFDMLVDWLRKTDVKPEIVERLVVGYCRRNRKAHPTPPFQEDED